MDKFLRPETVFGNKFEGYLNEKPYINKNSSNAAESNISCEKYDSKVDGPLSNKSY